jgi:hypothetical protein
MDVEFVVTESHFESTRIILSGWPNSILNILLDNVHEFVRHPGNGRNVSSEFELSNRFYRDIQNKE